MHYLMISVENFQPTGRLFSTGIISEFALFHLSQNRKRNIKRPNVSVRFSRTILRNRSIHLDSRQTRRTADEFAADFLSSNLRPATMEGG